MLARRPPTGLIGDAGYHGISERSAGKLAASSNDSRKIGLATGAAKESDEAAVWEGAALLAKR